MPKRRPVSKEYIDPAEIPERTTPVDSIALAIKVPLIVTALGNSMIKQYEVKPDWSLYRIETRNGNPFIVRDYCDRCGKVYIYPKWRKIRAYDDPDIGTVYLETGICKDCINAAVYVDSYLDGEVLTEKEAKQLFYQYAEEYEKTWRYVIAAAPKVIITEAEWQKACRFFNGCAICGGPIEVRAKYFPRYLNGEHTAWNVIPLCSDCVHMHYAGRVNKEKQVKRYKVFSTQTFFNKSKTARMYLLQQMRIHDIYMDPLVPYLTRFKESGTLKGSD